MSKRYEGSARGIGGDGVFEGAVLIYVFPVLILPYLPYARPFHLYDAHYIPRNDFTEQNACKILAKDLVRTRRYMQKFTQMRVQLQAVSLRMQTLRSNEQMASAMKGATRVRLLTSHHTCKLTA